MIRIAVALALISCGGKAPPPAKHDPAPVVAAPPAPPARTPHTAPPDCSTPSRTCVWVAEAKRLAPLDVYATTHYGDQGTSALSLLRKHPGFEVLIVDPAVVLRI